MDSSTSPTQTARSAFPIPFTQGQMREDILKIYLLQARTAALVVPHDTPWLQAGSDGAPTTAELRDPDQGPQDYGFTYAQVKQSPLAAALEQEYEFAFLGRLVPGIEAMEYESEHMWIADLLMDMSGSQLAREWESYGVELADAVARCLHVCELANARLVLEGREAFSYFDNVDGPNRKGRRNDPEDATSFDGLTIRQMALLSGMEEMTIRTAASRPGPNLLPTFKDDKRRTLVKPDDAKKWLIAKGRYVTVTKGSSAFDLAKTPLTSVLEFNHYLRGRITELDSSGEPVAELLAALSRLIGPGKLLQVNDLTREQLLDAELIGKLAPLLSVPAAVLVPRARQAALRDELAELEQQIRQVPTTAEPMTVTPPDA